jgi:hypothetical protein
MSLTIKTNNPAGLLTAIKKAIDEETIETWSYDSDGDLTHTPTQWKGKAYLKPSIENAGELNFTILKPHGVDALTDPIRGVYHGRFIECYSHISKNNLQRPMQNLESI